MKVDRLLNLFRRYEEENVFPGQESNQTPGLVIISVPVNTVSHKA